MIEIERTYLVERMPEDLSHFKLRQIRQGYLSEPPSPLRIREKDDKFELTKKLPLRSGDYTSAEEINIPLTEAEFKKLWTLVGKSLEKARYFIPLEDQKLVAELDIFQGPLKGLVLVEVEFTDEAQMNSFRPPEWFGRDVTDEPFSANVFLAGKTWDEVKSYLA